jgi:transcriptional regulator with XRE-family HTH domain
MNDEKLKAILGSNIVSYRKQQGLTQAGLAEKLNYSDKAVSKWERGESMPDVLTLVQVADLFGISVDDLLTDPNSLPEEKSAVVGKMEKAVERTLKRKADKLSILGLSSLLVWFVALLLFVIISSLGIAKSWLAFFYAVPANAIVLLSLLSAWHDFRWNKTLVSVIVWGCLLSLYMSLLIFLKVNIWKLFLLGIPGQLAIFLWFRLFRKQPKEEKNG